MSLVEVGVGSVEVHSGTEPSAAMDAIFDSRGERITEAPLKTLEIIKAYEDLMISLKEIHKQVDDAKVKEHKRNCPKHRQRKTRELKTPNFARGYFVLWADVDDKITKEKFQVLIDHIGSQGMTLETDKLKALRLNPLNKKWEILVSWRGFEIVEDSWEPFEILCEDIPRKTLEFLSTRSIEKHDEIRKLSRKY